MERTSQREALPCLTRLFSTPPQRDYIMADRGGGLKTSSSAKNNKDNNANKKKYYAVASGRKPGVYETWDECKKQVFSFPNAQHKVNNTFPPFVCPPSLL